MYQYFKNGTLSFTTPAPVNVNENNYKIEEVILLLFISSLFGLSDSFIDSLFWSELPIYFFRSCPSRYQLSLYNSLILFSCTYLITFHLFYLSAPLWTRSCCCCCCCLSGRLSSYLCCQRPRDDINRIQNELNAVWIIEERWMIGWDNINEKREREKERREE